MKTLSLAIISVMIVSYMAVIDPSSFCLYDSDAFLSIHHLSYMFMHVSLLHLMCNAWFLLDMSYRAKFMTPLMWALCFVIALVMPNLDSMPVAGLSGVLYAASGFVFIYSKHRIRIITTIFVMTVMQLMLGRFAASFHILCFIASIIASLILLPIYDCQRHD